jgi:hypothetical protein
MERKAAIHRHIEAAALELLEFVKERMPLSSDGWVPASEIKQSLALNFVAVPRGGKQYGEKGWLFAILARSLEDRDLLEHRKSGARAFYRAKKGAP